MPTKKEIAAANEALSAAATPGATPANTWSDSSAACVCTWLSLNKGSLNELDVSFDAAETKKMDEFESWNDKATPAEREIIAMGVARILTVILITKYAKYETKHNQITAVIALTKILTDPAKTVCELAAVVDETHRFPVGDNTKS